jgi:hypothetical protein
VVDDAKPLLGFLDAQFSAAKTQDLQAGYEIKFEQGLEMTGDAPERLAEKPSKYASGAAFVTVRLRCNGRLLRGEGSSLCPVAL